MDVKSDYKSNRIELSRINHRGENKILLSFPYDKVLIERIKTITGRRYSKTYKSWYLPYKASSIVALKELKINYFFQDEDLKDPLFLNHKEDFHVSSSSSSSGNEVVTIGKIHFLVESFLEKDRALLKWYIAYLCESKYSWNSVRLFSKYAAAHLNNDAENFRHRNTMKLSIEIYQGILGTFLEFRKSQ